MKAGDRVAIKVSEIQDMLGWLRNFDEHLKARATINRTDGEFAWVTWDQPSSIQNGGWLKQRFIPEDKVHLETL